MLVEDDNSLRQIYADRLAAEGYDIVTASDGEEALAMAIKERPDLIIADIMMPKVSGFDMLDILRSTTETKDTKIIMMTALSQAEDKVRAEKLGADKYLVKSQVTLEDVAREAAEMLNTQESSDNEAVATMTGDTDAGKAAAPVPQTPAPTQAAEPAPTPQPPTPQPTPEQPQTPAPTPAPQTTSIPVASPPQDNSKPAPAPDDTADEPEVKQEPTPEPAPEPSPEPTPAPETSAEQSTAEQNAEQKVEALSPTTEDEEAVMKNQIDSFIASNPTLTDQATPGQTPPTTTQPAQAEPKKIPITQHDDSSAQKAPAPATTEQDKNPEATKALDGLIDDAGGNNENKHAALEPQSPPEPEEKSDDNSYVADEKTSDDSSSETAMKHKKRIEPDADITSNAPDINELLKQAESEAAAPPPVGSEIVPGGGSVSQLKDADQNVVPQQQTPPADTPQDNNQAPGNISL